MQANANPIEQSKFNQTLLVDPFGQSYFFLPAQANTHDVPAEQVQNSIEKYNIDALLQNHSVSWGQQFDIDRLYQQVSNDYLAHHKSRQDKLSWLSRSIMSGEVSVFKGENFAPLPPTDAEGGIPVASVPEKVISRVVAAKESLGHGGRVSASAQPEKLEEPRSAKPKASGDGKIKSFAQAEKRLAKAREEIKERKDAGEPAYKPKYSDDELVKMANSGATANDRFLVSIQPKNSADDAKLAFQRDSGLVPTWTTSFDQIEAADSDPELIYKVLGNGSWYDPKKDYVMHIIDRGENLDRFGGNTVVPTWENMGDVVTKNVEGHDKDVLISTMNSGYQAEYADKMTSFWGVGGKEFNPKQINEYASSMPPNEADKFLARHEVRTEIGANAEFIGNGLTANTADGGGQYGVVETLSIEKDLPPLTELQTSKSGGSPIVRTVNLIPIK
ncbi:hypothetical protein F9L16_09990 [Agarivorans sp. B2Z047]|uniref:hypothetical protein n=1 Tax=Agarivorans sp. B2Z047 TaxID=2652721 RepID=UPI00128CB251|nr:hypothetical protein [Agarivorans sp. B2Z047]MPW29327.1 hypothetical protein [Agarivorans sp. B2Z047]UQN44914.1 hypothetical protein LQZ07_10750 [Agarivorans sp. B2Z047]